MKKNKPGSLIIMALIVMTALIVILHSMARSASYLVLLAQERKK
jgi:hypothetical protein